MPQLAFLPTRPRGQLLKWVGSKFGHAGRIVSHFPSGECSDTFYVPFVGSGAVLATRMAPSGGSPGGGRAAPASARAGDTLAPLIEMWQALQSNPEALTGHYREVISRYREDPEATYQRVVERYNENPNGPDLAVLSRTCFGGVIRFTKEGAFSTPIGTHSPISPKKFRARARRWRSRVRGVTFLNQPFGETMKAAGAGDLVYCDPPYRDSQAMLYGSQGFSFGELIRAIARCKERGAKVALSTGGGGGGGRKTGPEEEEKAEPRGLLEDVFEREVCFSEGSPSASMLKRFQCAGEVMSGEGLRERLLLSW